MKRESTLVCWMGVAFAVGIGLAATALTIKGTNPGGVVVALQMTARWAFLLFWIAYAGRAIGVLFGPAFEPIAKRGREFGMAYAAAMLVHFSLAIWLFQISSRAPLSGRLLDLFIVGIFFTYLLAVFSVGGLSKALGSKGWHALRSVGSNYILFAFAYDFVPASIHGTAHYGAWRLLLYSPFAAMCIGAPLLVLAAAAQRRMRLRYAHLEMGPVVN